MSEYGISPSIGQTPALRSPGHGVWKHEQGPNYSFTFIHYRYDASGVFIGSNKITASLLLGASGDEFQRALQSKFSMPTTTWSAPAAPPPPGRGLNKRRTGLNHYKPHGLLHE